MGLARTCACSKYLQCKVKDNIPLFSVLNSCPSVTLSLFTASCKKLYLVRVSPVWPWKGENVSVVSGTQLELKCIKLELRQSHDWPSQTFNHHYTPHISLTHSVYSSLANQSSVFTLYQFKSLCVQLSAFTLHQLNSLSTQPSAFTPHQLNSLSIQ